MGTEDKQTTRGTGRGDEDEDQLIIIPLANGRSLMAGPPSAREVRPPLLVVSTGRGVCGGVRGHSGWGAGKGTARAFSFVFRPIALAACQRLEKSRAISRQPRDSLPWGGGTWGGADVCRGPMAQGWRGRRRRTAGGPGGQRPASCCKRKKRADCANEAD